MGYTCSFGNSQFSLYLNSNNIGIDILSRFNNLYLLNIIVLYYETFHVSSRGTKRKLTNEYYTTLWYKRLGHISKNIIERLVSMEFLIPLILQTSQFVLSVLRESKQRTRGWEPIER